MNKIQLYARFLEFLCFFICIPLVLIAFIYKWFFSATLSFNTVNAYISLVGIDRVFPWLFSEGAPSMLMRISAAIIDGISVGLFIWGIFCFIQLLRRYSVGEFFSERTLALYVRLSRVAFAFALYNPFKEIILSVVRTLNNPVGHREVSIAIGSDDILHIFIVGFFLVMTLLMREAYELKREHDLTV